MQRCQLVLPSEGAPMNWERFIGGCVPEQEAILVWELGTNATSVAFILEGVPYAWSGNDFVYRNDRKVRLFPLCWTKITTPNVIEGEQAA